MATALHLIDDIAGAPRGLPCPRALVADLPANARLLLWSLRLLAQNAADRDVLRQELWLCCGPADVETTLGALEDLTALLRRDGRRPFLLKPAEARRMTAVEESLMALFAAAAQEDHARQRAHARWLARPLAQSELILRMRRLARGFSGL